MSRQRITENEGLSLVRMVYIDGRSIRQSAELLGRNHRTCARWLNRQIEAHEAGLPTGFPLCQRLISNVGAARIGRGVRHA